MWAGAACSSQFLVAARAAHTTGPLHRPARPQAACPYVHTAERGQRLRRRLLIGCRRTMWYVNLPRGGPWVWHTQVHSRQKLCGANTETGSMAMSSFLMNSTPYVEPKFPPSEEYSQHSYIPTQSPDDYYRHAGGAGYPAYPPPDMRRYNPVPNHGPAHDNFNTGTVTAYGNCTSVSPGPLGRMDNGTIGAGQPYSSPPQPAHSESPGSAPSPGPPNGQTIISPGGSPANPPMIYPWMKRVHVGSGKHPMLSVGS